MRNTLTIARREVFRLRTRFRGRSRVVILIIIAAAAVLSYFASQQGLMVARDFYSAGRGPGAPEISDPRFRVLETDAANGRQLLVDGVIDVYVDESQVLWREDQRSQSAAGTLKQYLEDGELARIADEYEIDDAFPLRVEIHHVATPDEAAAGDAVSIWNALSSPASAAVAPADTTPAPVEAAPTFGSSPTPTITDASGSSSSDTVREQLDGIQNGGGLPEFKVEFVSDNEIIVPSLMNPPMPLSQIILAFLYVVPIFFVSIFFTSSFMEEKLNRKLNVLLSAPVTPLQIIAGKMLPYLGYSLVSIIAITLALGGDILLAVVIFVPIVLFIFSLYLMVALLYRTFKDQTFFSLLAVTLITVYLVFPSMFSGISELSHISPLHLAIQMYKGETFGLSEYLLATAPMYLMFGVGLFIGVRIFNEEFLMGFRPLHRKLGDAVLLTINRQRLHFSILLLSLFLIPAVFMVQLASLVIAFNLPTRFAIVVALTISVVVEEIAKSAGIVILIQNRIALSMRKVVSLSAASALGFFVGEKFLLWVALRVIPQSTFTDAIFGTGLLIVPLLAHFFFTAMVCLLAARFGTKSYVMAIAGGSLLHILYNLLVAGVLT